MKFLFLIFTLSVGLEALAVEVDSECPMMRESNRRENLKSSQFIQSKKMAQKSRTTAQ